MGYHIFLPMVFRARAPSANNDNNNDDNNNNNNNNHHHHHHRHRHRHHHHHYYCFASFCFSVPPEILPRGPLAVDAYNKALADGKTSVKRVPIMLTRQDRASMTSLRKSLRGICFDPKEDSTIGIDVDPSHFKVTKETWRTGTKKKDQNAFL